MFQETIKAMYNPLNTGYIFYAYTISKFKVQFSESLNAPAAVHLDKGVVLTINKTKFSEYPLEIRLGILKHEVLHVLFKHFTRKYDRNLKTWQFSTDCAINQYIDSNHLPYNAVTPKNLEVLLNIELLRFKSAEFYYDILINYDLSELEQPNEHSDNYETDSFSDIYIDKIIEDVTDEIGIDYLPKSIQEVIQPKSIKSWDSVYRQLLLNSRKYKRKTIKRKSRRFPDNPMIKGTTKETKFNLGVILDVSASVCSEDIANSIARVRELSEEVNAGLYIVQVDSVAHEPEIITKQTKEFIRKGSGGTFLSKGLPSISKINPEILLVITDGELQKRDFKEFNNYKKKIFWLILNNNPIPEALKDSKNVYLI